MTNAGLGAAERATRGAGAARTLLTEASASAAETEEIMRAKENISRTLRKRQRQKREESEECKKPTSGLEKCEDERK